MCLLPERTISFFSIRRRRALDMLSLLHPKILDRYRSLQNIPFPCLEKVSINANRSSS